MHFPLFSALRRKMNDIKSDTVTEFYSHIDYLLEKDEVKKLDDFIQHHCFTRLKHSLDVAYYSFLITRFFGWDSASTARAGLLHDLFLYDWREEEDCSGRQHMVNHPQIALENARKICSLNQLEENIILRHMWLMTPIPPRYKEGYVVTFVDKFCAIRELCISICTSRSMRKSLAGNPAV